MIKLFCLPSELKRTKQQQILNITLSTINEFKKKNKKQKKNVQGTRNVLMKNWCVFNGKYIECENDVNIYKNFHAKNIVRKSENKLRI